MTQSHSIPFSSSLFVSVHYNKSLASSRPLPSDVVGSCSSFDLEMEERISGNEDKIEGKDTFVNEKSRFNTFRNTGKTGKTKSTDNRN